MILEDAIAYRRRGFSVIPIRPKDKKPLISWEPFQLEPASEAMIEEWFKKWPDANIGLVTGAISDSIVLDLDSQEAKERLKNLAGDFDLASVPRSRTGKGWQLFFKHPEVTIPNRTGVFPGLDVRGDGGYVVAPPSIHPNGKQYHWEVPLNGQLPPLPVNLFQLIHQPEGDTYRQRFNTAEALKGVPRGMQRVTAFRLACKLRHADVPYEQAEKLILECAGNCEPPLSEREALEQLASAYKRYAPGNGTNEQAEIWPVFKSAAEILAEPDEPIGWRWDECLPEAGSSLLVAQPKIGKTTFASNLALSVARGLPFLGRPTYHCAVAYAYLDGPPREIKDTFKRLGLKGSDLVYIHAGAAPRDYVGWIIAQIKEHAARFIIIDTFQKFFKIDNLNDYSEVVNKSTPMLDAASAENVHLMFLHHAGKGDRGDLDSAIGSTALRGQVQSYLHLKLLPDSNRRIFRSDQRYGQGNFPETAIGFDRNGWLEVKGCREDAEIEEAQPKIVEFLQTQDSEVTEREILRAINLRAIIVSKAIRQLFKNNDVERTGRGRKGDPFRYSTAVSLDSLPEKGVIGGKTTGRESENGQQELVNTRENSLPKASGKSREEQEENLIAGREFFGSASAARLLGESIEDYAKRLDQFFCAKKG